MYNQCDNDHNTNGETDNNKTMATTIPTALTPQ
jgi:hypothetical protein